MFDYLKPSLTALLTKGLNAYLALDGMSQERITKLQGYKVSIEFQPFGIVLHCLFTDNSMQIIDDQKESDSFVADTKISGTVMQLLNVMLAEGEQKKVFAKDLLIEGNLLIAQQLLELFDAMNIDWEGYFARYAGDVPAYYTNLWRQRVKKFVKETRETLQHNLSEYIHEEAAWLPAKEALNDLCNDIDQTRMHVDRLDAKIQHIQSIIKPSDAGKDKP